MRRFLSTKVKDMNAITLIALVITIVVLIILAAVAINLSLGNNGIFKRAKEAREKYANEQESEKEKINDIYGKILLAADGSVSINMDTLESIILDKTYPVGSIYLTIDNTNPSDTLGGTWEQISQGRTLFGAGTLNSVTYTAGTTVDAGLPNITGYIGSISAHTRTANTQSGTGALYDGGVTNGYAVDSYAKSGYDRVNTFGFDASKSNSIYNNSTTVQPNAYVTYMWKRVS